MAFHHHIIIIKHHKQTKISVQTHNIYFWMNEMDDNRIMGCLSGCSQTNTQKKKTG